VERLGLQETDTIHALQETIERLGNSKIILGQTNADLNRPNGFSL
jgi:hypothetical protein